MATQPVPLARLYCLSPDDAPQVAIRPLGETAALLELLRHSRATNLMSSEAERQRHFRESVELVRQVPIAQLDRVRSLGTLPQLLSAIEADLAWAYVVKKWPYLASKPKLVSPIEVRSTDGKGTRMYRLQLATSSQAQSAVICQRLETSRVSCVVVY